MYNFKLAFYIASPLLIIAIIAIPIWYFNNIFPDQLINNALQKHPITLSEDPDSSGIRIKKIISGSVSARFNGKEYDVQEGSYLKLYSIFSGNDESEVILQIGENSTITYTGSFEIGLKEKDSNPQDYLINQYYGTGQADIHLSDGETFKQEVALSSLKPKESTYAFDYRGSEKIFSLSVIEGSLPLELSDFSNGTFTVIENKTLIKGDNASINTQWVGTTHQIPTFSINGGVKVANISPNDPMVGLVSEAPWGTNSLNNTENINYSESEEIWKYYFDSDKLHGSDFEILNGWYAKDNKDIYSHYEYCHDGASCGNKSTRILENPMTDSFVVLYKKYAKDKNTIYFEGSYIRGADPKSFIVLEDEIGKDMKHVYYKDNLFMNTDVQTFKMLSAQIGKDKNNAYYINTVEHDGSEKDDSSIIEDLNPNGLEVIGNKLVKNTEGTFRIESIGLNHTRAVKN